MSLRIKELMAECEYAEFHCQYNMEKFAELIKREIYEEVKKGLMSKSEIESEPHELDKSYLRGCNAGTLDAMFIIKNFGVDANNKRV